MTALRQLGRGMLRWYILVMAAAAVLAAIAVSASSTAASEAPAAPGNVTVTRGTFGYGVLNVSWRVVEKEVVYYNVRYTDDGGRTWEDGPSRVQGTSATITGVNDALPYYVAVQAHNGKSGSAWTQSALANVECPAGHACKTDAVAQSNPPDAPSSITLERTGVGFRGKGTLTASWPAVSGATKYQVNYTADKGRVWKTLASEHTSNSITFEIWNGNTYYVGVRAGNANGWSGWTNSPESPPIPNALPSNMLPGPDWVSVTRGNGTLTATWAAVSGATRYRIEYSTDFGTTYQLVSYSETSTSITINVNNGSTYTIAVRAGKGSEDRWSNYGPISYSASSGPYTPSPPPSPSLSAGSVTHNTATLTLSNHGWQWWYKADTGPHATCSNIAVAGSSVNLSGLTPSTQYTYTAYSNWVCNTAIATASAFTTAAPPPTLTTSAITRTTATLTIANHTAQWWYQADVGPDSTCQGPVAAGTSAESLTGLTDETTYVYKAYSATGCAAANLLATAASFTTLPPPHVTNLQTVSLTGSAINSATKQGVAFTTGSNAGGYTLTSVTISMRKSGSPTPSNLAITLHSMDGSSPYDNNTSYPSSTTKATLTGTAPTSTSFTDTIFTCSGSGCELDPGATYFVVASYSGNSQYEWRYAADALIETNHPSDNGWNIGYSHFKNSGQSWNSWSDWHIFRADFEFNPSLTASSITSTGATLTMAHHTGTWYYKATTGPHTTCQGPVAANTSTKTLTGLTPGTSYTYSAYSDSGCTTANLLATASAFTTSGVSVSTLDGALFQSYQVGNYNSTQQQGAQAFTTGSNTGGYTLSSIDIRFDNKIGSPTDLVVTLHAASGSNPNTTTTLATLSGASSPSSAGVYTYTCSGSGCDLSASTTYFVLMKAPNSTGTSYYQVDLTAAAETKQPSNNGWSIADKGRDGLYGNWFDMTAAVKMKVAATVNTSGQGSSSSVTAQSGGAAQSGTLTVDRLHATSAVLDFNISQITYNWHYKADTGPHAAACSARLNVHHDAHVGGLTPLTEYTYRAYSDANCANEAASITFTTLRVDLDVSNLTAGSVTLTPNPAHWPSATTYYLKGTTLAGCEPYTGSANNIRLWPLSQFTFEMHSTSSCNDSPHLGYAEFIGPYATLTATHVSANSATLELGGWTQREWYYRRTQPSGDNTCHKKDAGDTTVTLTGLQPNTQYAYWAYRNSNCAAQNSLRSTNAPGITFTTVSMAASEPGATTATITLNGGHHGQPWWYAETAMNPSYTSGQPFASNCHYGGVSKSGGSSVVVRGLVPGNGNSSKSYTFTAYSDADCSVARAMGSVDADTMRPTLSANKLSGGGARLTLGNWGANDPDWRYRANVVVPHSGNIVLHGADGCLGPVTGGALQTDIDSLPSLSGYGAYYVFTAYSASGCHYSKVTAAALLGGPPGTPSLTASGVTQTGAALAIANHPGTWYYKADAGPHATCQGPVHAATETLTGLAAGATYNYTAYSDSGCSSGNLLATAAAFTTNTS